METIGRFLKTGKESFFLHSLSLDLPRPKVFRNYSAYPERPRETVLANKDKKTIVIVPTHNEMKDSHHWCEKLVEKNHYYGTMQNNCT